MFKKYSHAHNKGVYIGFNKPSECRMAGEHIALLRLVRLKDALRGTITSKEFLDLRAFHTITSVLNDPEFWTWLFVMCRALYAPMRVLRLADQKTPAMDKLFYYVSQTDRMLLKYLGDVRERSASLLSDATSNAIDTSTFSAGVSDDDSDGSDTDDDDNEEPGSDDAESVESNDSGEAEDGDDDVQ